jgi:hypothetical protein
MLDPTGNCEFPKCRNYAYDNRDYCPHHKREVGLEEQKIEGISVLSEEVRLLRQGMGEIVKGFRGKVELLQIDATDQKCRIESLEERCCHLEVEVQNLNDEVEPTLMHIWLVVGETSEYDDRSEWVVIGYLDEGSAYRHAKLAEEEADIIFKEDDAKYYYGGEKRNKYDDLMQMQYTGTTYSVTKTILAERL